LTPTLHAGLVRLGTCLSFGQAVKLLAAFTHVTIAEATARRQAEQAGAAYVAVQTAEAARLAQETPPAPPGPATQQLSVDGAMVPLRRGEWGEVKTLAIGTVVAAPTPEDPRRVRAVDLSYFSRSASAETFTELATVETHRRGVETAGRVAAVGDGAVWLQGFVDVHRPDAIRILDSPHALEHLSEAAAACLGEGTAAAHAWGHAQRTELLTGDPALVLAALAALEPAPGREPVAAAAVRDRTVGYFATRHEQIRYADFRAQGLPIGSGAVESANKLVVEARLKGPGMRWARPHVDPMVALRTIEANDRWEEAWPQITHELQDAARRRTGARHRGHRTSPPPRPPIVPTPALPASARSPLDDERDPAPSAPPVGRPRLVIAGRPTAVHPWKRAFRTQQAPTQPTQL
jgi:hypothetical protein